MEQFPFNQERFNKVIQDARRREWNSLPHELTQGVNDGLLQADDETKDFFQRLANKLHITIEWLALAVYAAVINSPEFEQRTEERYNQSIQWLNRLLEDTDIDL